MRSSGLPYTILRPTGLITNENTSNPILPVILSQGDVVSGRISRRELANIILVALSTNYAVDKTVEVRRDESGKYLGELSSIPEKLFRPLHQDKDRTVVGILPFPDAKDPASPLPQSAVAQILNDPRVKAVRARDDRNAG